MDDFLSQFQFVAIVEQTLYRRHSTTDVQPELCGHVRHLSIGLGFAGMESWLKPPSPINKGQTECVVEVGMCLQGVFELEAMGIDAAFQQLLFMSVPSSAIDDCCLECLFVPEEESILLYRVAGKG